MSYQASTHKANLLVIIHDINVNTIYLFFNLEMLNFELMNVKCYKIFKLWKKLVNIAIKNCKYKNIHKCKIAGKICN